MSPSQIRRLRVQSSAGLFLVLILSALTPVCVRAHSTVVIEQVTGEIRLEVKAASGLGIRAIGRIVNLATGSSTAFETDGRGAHRFENVTPGRYRLEISSDGFSSRSILIDVEPSQAVTRTVTLVVSDLAFEMDVVAATPLAGLDLDGTQIPAPAQSAKQEDIERSGAIQVADFLNRRFGGVHVNEIQGNPFQPDLNYRGYTASPLLGTPQGLSVFLDGVRLNQPFGDVVSWDLIPLHSISEVTMMPGSNPLFGLNTLGGAISIQSKDGRSDSGTSLELSGGSFGRKTADVEHGGFRSNGLNWYVGSTLFFEDGWRQDSPSNVRQFYGKLGWQGEKTTLALTGSFANNHLVGNGLQEQRFLDRDYRSVYTKPDITDNRSPVANLAVRHSFAERLSFSGNAYYRYIGTRTFNGDINEESLDQALYQPNAAERAALTAAGYTGFPTSGESASNTPFPFWRCIAQGLLRDEPSEKCSGLLNRTATAQRNYGVAGQVSWLSAPGARRNQLTVGGAYDGSSSSFNLSSQLGYLNPDRSITGINAYGDGITGGDADGEPYDTRVDLRSQTNTGSFFGIDTLLLGKGLNLTLAGRFNRTAIENNDRIRPGGGTGSLDGSHVFQRFNPAVGLTYSPRSSINLFFGYNEGSRAPTAIELGCADENEPCKLPNAMTGDPPLQQVVTRTFEAGVRGSSEMWNWSASWYRADNRQDILFVASSQTGFGYFKNFGKTRRQGMRVDVSGRIGRLGLGSSYNYLLATFENSDTVVGSSNSSNESAQDGVRGVDGSIEIPKGSRIPLVPAHLFKAFADLRASKNFTVSIGLVAASSSYARGNENNMHEPDARYYLGSGRSLGYAVANLGARYQMNRWLGFKLEVNNLFDAKYHTAAQLGSTGFTESGNFVARPFPAVGGEFPVQHATFYSPGAPRGIWGGVSFDF